MSDIKELQDEIAAWANEVLPKRTSKNAMIKLVMEEIPEMMRKPKDKLEYADVVILVLDIAYLNGVDIREAVLEKMEINRNRIWAQDPDTGIFRHVKKENLNGQELQRCEHLHAGGLVGEGQTAVR